MELTIKRLRDVLNYNASDGEWTWLKSTGPGCNIVPGARAGSIDKAMGYRIISLDGEQYRAARLSYFYVYGRWPKRHMDHIDGNRANDAWPNLREANSAQNAINRAGWGKSTFKGVDLHKGKWRARLRIDGKLVDLGYFESATAAATAYDVNVARRHGEFARLNFPEKAKISQK